MSRETEEDTEEATEEEKKRPREYRVHQLSFCECINTLMHTWRSMRSQIYTHEERQNKHEELATER